MFALAFPSDLIMYVICRCGIYINTDLNNGLPLAYAFHINMLEKKTFMNVRQVVKIKLQG